jgi:hypothetical protein
MRGTFEAKKHMQPARVNKIEEACADETKTKN